MHLTGLWFPLAVVLVLTCTTNFMASARRRPTRPRASCQDLVCERDEICEKGRFGDACEKKPDIGFSCNSNGDCLSNYCGPKGTCQKPSSCQDLTCGPDEKCVRSRQGVSCQGAKRSCENGISACRPDESCERGREGQVCEKKPGVGASCSSSQDCLSNYCNINTGRCQRPTSCQDLTCKSDESCEKDRNGVLCQKKPDIGFSCSSNGDCLSNYCGPRGTCQKPTSCRDLTCEPGERCVRSRSGSISCQVAKRPCQNDLDCKPDEICEGSQTGRFCENQRASGLSCTSDSDCASKSCDRGTCA